MNERITPESVWREFLRADSYNRAIGLYDNVKKNEDFYIGNQWEGVSAPDLEKPVLNFLRRVVTYFIAMIVSDDVGVALSPMRQTTDAEFICDVLSGEVERVLEKTKAKSLSREMLRNCVIDGDGCFFCRFEPTGGANGEIKIECAENTKVLFGNPFLHEVQSQPHILLVQRCALEELRREAKAAGGVDWENIKPDSRDSYQGEELEPGRDLVTVLIRLWKENGRLYFSKSTREVMLKPPMDSGLALYPIAWMNWENVKNSYHGQGALTGLIPNQIFVNKLWAMAMEHQKRLAFPKLFYDMTKIREWSNRVGQAIGVAGDPNTAIASSFRAADMSAQVLELVDKTINYTRDFMGASDVALGNVRPDNTSAIIAVQKSSAAPLELQRLAYYQFWEDSVNIILDNIRAYYGTREITYMTEQGSVSDWLDFSAVDYDELSLKVDIGAASYWSELMQVETADNLFERGIVTDAITYLESVPDAYIHNKNRLIAKIRERGMPLETAESADIVANMEAGGA